MELPEDVDAITDPQAVGELRRSVKKFTEACRTSLKVAKNAVGRKPEDFGWRSNPCVYPLLLRNIAFGADI